MIKERRSVRRYKNEKVDRELLKEIIELSRWSPSWANTQVARYTIVDNEDLIKRIAEEGVKGFAYNIKTLQNTKGVIVLSFVKGKSGKLGSADYDTTDDNKWEIFDAGIACQTFCLAAHAKGVGTCVFGIIDDDAISSIAGLPKDEVVGCVITYGYEDGEHAKATPRKSVEEIMRIAGE